MAVMHNRIRNISIDYIAPHLNVEDYLGSSIFYFDRKDPAGKIDITLGYWDGESKVYHNVTEASGKRVMQVAKRFFPGAIPSRGGGDNCDYDYEYLCPQCGGEV